MVVVSGRAASLKADLVRGQVKLGLEVRLNKYLGDLRIIGQLVEQKASALWFNLVVGLERLQGLHVPPEAQALSWTNSRAVLKGKIANRRLCGPG